MSPYRDSAKPRGPGLWSRIVAWWLRQAWWISRGATVVTFVAALVSGVFKLVACSDRNTAETERRQREDCVVRCRALVSGTPIVALCDWNACACDAPSGVYSVERGTLSVRKLRGRR